MHTGQAYEFPKALKPFVDTAPELILLYCTANALHASMPWQSLPKFEQSAARLEGLLADQNLQVQERIGLMGVLKDCYFRLITETGLPDKFRRNTELRHGFAYYMLQNERLDTEFKKLGIHPN